MTTYKQLRSDPASRDLFNKRVATIQGLRDALKDSTFIAIDTEHVLITSEKDRIFYQVGLAHLQTLELSKTFLDVSRPSLQEFYNLSQIRALTLNVNRDQTEQDVIRLGGHKGLPARRPHRFGQEQQVNLENLEEAIIDFIQSCDTKKKLVLIGFEMSAEWKYLFTTFPLVIPYFSAWLDLREIAKDITSSVGVIPGLTSLLQIFGYHWKDIQPGKGNNGGTADNAGDDAVATCALGSALFLPDNHEKLRFRQECGQIARIFIKKKGYQTPNERDRFTVTIGTEGPLPLAIYTAMKLARYFFRYSPQYAGVMSEVVAYLTLRSQDQLDNFTTATDGLTLPTGERLSVQAYHGTEVSESEDRERKEKQDLRQRKKLERTGSEVENLGSLFTE